MPAKYPEPFPAEVDINGIEIVLTHVIELLDRHVMAPRDTTIMRGMMVRCSPYAREKWGPFKEGSDVMAAARFDGWDGAET